MLVPFLTAAISMGVVYLYGAVGETLIEKGGSLNLGIPGIMCAWGRNWSKYLWSNFWK